MACSLASSCVSSQVSSVLPSSGFYGANSRNFRGGVSFAYDNVPKCFAGLGPPCQDNEDHGLTVHVKKRRDIIEDVFDVLTDFGTWLVGGHGEQEHSDDHSDSRVSEGSLITAYRLNRRQSGGTEGFSIPEPPVPEPPKPPPKKIDFKKTEKVFEIKGGDGWVMPAKPPPKVIQIVGGPEGKPPAPPKPPPKILKITGGDNWTTPPLPQPTAVVKIKGDRISRPEDADPWEGYRTKERYIKEMKALWEQGYRAEPVIN